MLNNGTQPAVVIGWDGEKQGVAITLDPAQVKNWSFAKALLLMAVEVAEQQIKVAQVAGMQQAMIEQQQAQQLAQKLRLK